MYLKTKDNIIMRTIINRKFDLCPVQAKCNFSVVGRWRHPKCSPCWHMCPEWQFYFVPVFILPSRCVMVCSTHNLANPILSLWRIKPIDSHNLFHSAIRIGIHAIYRFIIRHIWFMGHNYIYNYSNNHIIMRKKTLIIQIAILPLFGLIALGSSSSSNTGRSSYSGYSSPSYTPSSGSSYIQKTDFPDEPCHTCKGRKGYYLFDQWYACKRCGGSGKEPKH